MVEEIFVKEIKNLVSKLNDKFNEAAERGIQVEVDDMDITIAGDKAKRTLLVVKLFKVL